VSTTTAEKKENIRELRLHLETDVFEKIDFCKKVLGIQTSTDFMRYLINKEYSESVDKYNALKQKEKEMKRELKNS
jgi:hypothetical protein